MIVVAVVKINSGSSNCRSNSNSRAMVVRVVEVVMVELVLISEMIIVIGFLAVQIYSNKTSIRNFATTHINIWVMYVSYLTKKNICQIS